jgi:hypothetical protein
MAENGAFQQLEQRAVITSAKWLPSYISVT